MGIQGLMKLISEEAPDAIKEQDMDELTGRKIAIDASMAMYQFLIAVRSNGPGGQGVAMQLTNDKGEVTSHIQGMFNRTIKMMTCGVKPVYVFDGKPPQMKGGELAKRMAKRAKAEVDLAAARDAGNIEDQDKFSSRLVKVTRQHNEDCKKLLRLMGVPVLDAPCEAEAQCAELAKGGKVYATATEDMDALTFRTPKLLRKMTFAASGKAQKQTVVEIDFESVIRGLRLTYDEFVDLCILCGCDYCSTIKGIGPKTALKLIREHKTIENIIKVLSREKKYVIPADWREMKVRLGADPEHEPEQEMEVEAEKEGKEEVTPEDNVAKPAIPVEVVAAGKLSEDAEEKLLAAMEAEVEEDETPLEDADADVGVLADDEEAQPEVEEEEAIEGVEGVDYEVIPPMYVQARKLFHHAEAHPAASVELKWSEPDEEGLKAFLVTTMGFQEERVENGIKKLKAAQQIKAQRRMDSFFAVIPLTADEANAKKRKADAARLAAEKDKKTKSAKGAAFAGKKK